jgi:predicted DNA-binding transcriptional regulator AlpA
MMILRPKVACERLGIGKSQFYDRYVYREGGPKFVACTESVPRLRAVPITARILGFIDAEVDAVIEAMADERDSGKFKRRARDEAGRFVPKEKRAAT